jgi:hypothetical protein
MLLRKYRVYLEPRSDHISIFQKIELTALSSFVYNLNK